MRPTFRTLRVDDARALQTLMAEHAESLDTGLKVHDERVVLGGGAVDLVALDAEGNLVLIAIALVADDAMLLRMLEAYAWSFEYPDAIGRLYPAMRTALDAPPRVMFVAERFPDAFLRKVKHLRMPSLDCLEVRYLEVNGVAGLYFNPVDEARPAEATAAVAPSPERVSVGAPPVPAAVPITPIPTTSIPTAPVAPAPAAPPAKIRVTPSPIEPVTPVTAAAASIAESVDAARVEPETLAAAPARSAVGRGTATLPVTEPAAATAIAVEPLAASIELEVVDPLPAEKPVIHHELVTHHKAGRAVGDGVRAVEAPPVELLEGLRMPETLSSQWRRVLTRTSEAPDAAKVLVVREYLQQEFPGCTVYDFYEHQRSAQVFHLQNSQGSLMHQAAVSDDFFEAESERNIRRFLDKNRLARALRDAGSSDVLVTQGGIRVAKA